ncbi:hypothetical protein EKD16_22060 [Streptomonospora litoralis]|uniref:DUF2637 domain-containing protein n=2 Tax=Streptomonospora litoralis TaxID=2498135 RepID=A0A4P6Q631_9ACTN|nr:DUF2637 domain-containing protein [Streptomonospora litoralis]QBI56165.1 hypothetical protein EKD16_22060 [Streptomonospora litoralis]
MLSVIAAVISYSHMYELVQRHGKPAWRAALFPLSVDGMIVASSMALLADARQAVGLLPWTLLILGSVARLAANIAVADPTLWSRVIHAWPSFALRGAYELLMREWVPLRDPRGGWELLGDGRFSQHPPRRLNCREGLSITREQVLSSGLMSGWRFSPSPSGPALLMSPCLDVNNLPPRGT